MLEAKCTLGSDETEAIAPSAVTIRPVTGDFGNGGGTITLSPNGPGDTVLMELVDPWLPNMLVAKLPDTNPGTGEEGEDFRIEVSPNDGEENFVADPVWVTGSKAKGWPPTHFPTMAAGRKQSERRVHR